MSNINNKSLEAKEKSYYLEKRMHIRYEFEKDIHYVLHEHSQKSFKGIIINISDAGMCFFTFHPLHEGQEIIIKTDEKSLNRRGNVRWCREMGDNVYKAGVEFY